jgi:hypothetical protein
MTVWLHEQRSSVLPYGPRPAHNVHAGSDRLEGWDAFHISDPRGAVIAMALFAAPAGLPSSSWACCSPWN